MQTYTHYKESGIDWIGQIPEHWVVRRFKYLFNEINERSIDGNEDLLSVSQYTGVTKKLDKLEDGDLLTNASTLEGYKKVRKHQLVSNIMLAWNGSLAFSEYNGITSPAYCIYELKHDDVYKYFHYLFKTDLYKSEFKRNSSGVIESRLRLYTDDFFSIWSVLPPIHEQEAIANFLDDKTAKIDALVQTKEQQIEKLKELRQAKIHQAVTKGLDASVPIKDSGIEWIGEIPAHWEVKKMKSISSKIGDGLHGTPEYDDSGEYYFINGNNLGDNKITIYDSTKLVNKKQFLLNKKPLNRQTILLSINGTIGNVSFYNDENVMLGKSACYINLNKDINKEFISYFLNSKSFKDYYSIVLSGSTIYNLSLHSVANVSFAYPPIQEQEQIVAYLDEVTGKIDQAVTQKQEQITKLKEYKQSLINDVVTGKVKVC